MVLEDLPDVPPAALLLITEVYSKAKTWADARKLLKGLLPELKAQSQAYDLQRFSKSIESSNKGEFDIHLDGALNIFARSSGGCADLDCRIAAVERMTRSIGLIADRIWVTDYLTETFCDFGRTTNAKLDSVIGDTLILGKLMPLVSAGILRFKSPWIPSCQGCLKHFEDRVDQITDDLVLAFKDGFRLEDMGEKMYTLHTGAVYSPPIVIRLLPGPTTPDAPPDVDRYIRQIVHDAVRSTMWAGREAAASQGSIFSNSRIGLAGLAHQEGRFQSVDDLRVLDERRSVDLPWVKELSPAQIMELRQEASRALPQLRELMATRLVFRETDNAKGSADDFVGELRQQAAEIRDELQIINRNSARFWRQPFTILSLGAAALGVATDQPLAAVGGLLALWQFLGTHEPGNEKEVEKLKCRPGFVLIKAHDLLAHAGK